MKGKNVYHKKGTPNACETGYRVIDESVGTVTIAARLGKQHGKHIVIDRAVFEANYTTVAYTLQPDPVPAPVVAPKPLKKEE